MSSALFDDSSFQQQVRDAEAQARAAESAAYIKRLEKKALKKKEKCVDRTDDLVDVHQSDEESTDEKKGLLHEGKGTVGRRKGSVCGCCCCGGSGDTGADVAVVTEPEPSVYD